MNYDDNGDLVLSAKLGEAVISGEGVEEYARALFSGKSESLTYQDMQDFQDFTREFFVDDWRVGRGDSEYFILLRRADQAPYGLSSDEHNGRYFGDTWTYLPMQPFTIQGYEPAE